jgi:hypothetical protein
LPLGHDGTREENEQSGKEEYAPHDDFLLCPLTEPAGAAAWPARYSCYVHEDATSPGEVAGISGKAVKTPRVKAGHDAKAKVARFVGCVSRVWRWMSVTTVWLSP